MNIEINENLNSIANSMIYFTKDGEVHSFVHACQFLPLEEEVSLMISLALDEARSKNHEIERLEIHISRTRKLYQD